MVSIIRIIPHRRPSFLILQVLFQTSILKMVAVQYTNRGTSNRFQSKQVLSQVWQKQALFPIQTRLTTILHSQIH